MNGNGHVVQACELHKSYRVGRRESPALRGVNLTLEAGQFAVLLGPSGAGKTTLLNLIGCLDRATDGELEVVGQSVHGNGSPMSEGAMDALRREHIGFVFSDFYLLPTLTALENVQVPLIWHDDRAPERARELLERVGLGHRLTHRPDELSGGEMQRVALARALINQPTLLLADEPTGNLDTHTRDEIFELLQDLGSDGLTVLFATHDTELAERGDTVVRIRDGVIVED